MKPVDRRRWTMFSAVVVAFGLLLWARLVLVTGHPRTATADPQGTPAAGAGTTAKPASAAPADGR